MTVVLDNVEITTPMKSKIFRYYCINIPKRSGTIHPINLDLKEDSVILNKQFKQQVFLSNGIASSVPDLRT